MKLIPAQEAYKAIGFKSFDTARARAPQRGREGGREGGREVLTSRCFLELPGLHA